MQDVDHLVLKVLEVQDTRQKIHQLQEELNWDRQNFEDMQGERHRNTQAQGRHWDLSFLPFLYLFFKIYINLSRFCLCFFVFIVSFLINYYKKLQFSVI